jgi:hypothetical protein
MSTPLDFSAHALLGLPRTSLAALRTALLRDAGWSYVGWLQEMGHAGGATAVASFGAWLTARGEHRPAEALDIGTFRALAVEYFREAGWGSLELSGLGDGLVALDSEDWGEADPAAQLPYPGCYVTSGLIGAFYSIVGQSPLAAMEVECRSTGASRCRWVLGSPEAIQHVYEGMARGEAYSDAAATLG